MVHVWWILKAAIESILIWSITLGSDDGMIKVWAGDGMNDLLMTLSEKSSVTCLCIDAVNGAVIAGLQHVIKYD